MCQRKIHKNCVRDYGNCTPWCYLGVGLEGFRVCVDCWVPESLKNSVRVPGRRELKGGLKDKGEAVDLIGNVFHNAKGGVEKKIKRVKAKVNVLRMANGDMNSVNFEDDGSDFSAEKDTNILKAGNSNSSDAVEVVDGAELAIQLHSVKNSSPRILRGKSLVNSSIGRWKGLCYKRSRFRKIWCDDRKLETGDDGVVNKGMNQHMENDPNIGLIPYKRDSRRKIWLLNNENVELENLHLHDPRTSNSTKSGANTSAYSICDNTDQPNGDRLGPQLIMYRRNRFKTKESQMSITLAMSRDSSYCDSHGVAFRSDNSQPDDTNISTGSPAKSDINVILPSESCDTERDRYQLKYFKRITDTKSSSHFLPFSTFLCANQVAATAVSNSEAGGSVDNGELILPNGTCDQETDRYSLKYAKRVKCSKSGSNFEAELQPDAFLNKVDISAAGLTMNFSAESRTVSDDS